jgi:hypothetical protein
VEENTKKLQCVAEDRKQSMFNMKVEIVGLSEELEIDLDVTALADLVFDSLRMVDLELVQRTATELRTKVSNRRTVVKEMLEQVTTLYERLAVPQEERCPIVRGRVCGLEELGKSANIELMKLELARLQELQAKNLVVILKKNKADLEILWRECMVGSMTKIEFFECALDDPDNELTRIEEEVQKTVQYKSLNLEVLKKLKKFLDHCQLANDLQMRLQDPSRLFKSRGLDMAKEETDRRKVNALPGLRKELLDFVETRGDLKVFDVNMSRLVEDNFHVFEQIYESSFSATAPSKTKARSADSRTSQSAQSPRSRRRQGHLVTAPGTWRPVSRPVSRSNSAMVSSTSTMNGSTSRMTAGSARTLDRVQRTTPQSEQSSVSRPAWGLQRSATVTSLPTSRPRHHDIAPKS